MFLDEVSIRVSGGKGGNGSASLHREKFAPRGGPDGGDGGRGGDVLVTADANLNSLQEYQMARNFAARAGGAGGPSNRHGAAGNPISLAVPVGTLVTDIETSELLADLADPGARVVVASGGRGGRGNVHFASSTNQAPSRREMGEPGQARSLQLELRLIADLGLVGLPNAGKSSLLARITGARPKIGDYPFTTLTPNLGMAMLGEELSLTVADVPGLIEGAHRGAGLGIAFLRHLQRTKALVHVVDVSQGGASATEAFRQVNEELTRHGLGLESKPYLVALNKVDLLSAKELAAVTKSFAKLVPGVSLLPISAATGDGCQELTAAAAGLAAAVPAPARPADPGGRFRLYQGPRAVDRNFVISRKGGLFEVEGESLVHLVSLTDLDDDSSVLHLQRQLRRIGVEEALAKAGARAGDEVKIGAETFTFYPEGAAANQAGDPSPPDD